jgi:hypothetical protein
MIIVKSVVEHYTLVAEGALSEGEDLRVEVIFKDGEFSHMMHNLKTVYHMSALEAFSGVREFIEQRNKAAEVGNFPILKSRGFLHNGVPT